MKLNNRLQLAFFQAAGYLIMGMLIATSTSVSVLANLAGQLSEDQPSLRSQLVQTANNLLNQGDLPGAEKSLRQLIKNYPQDAFGHYQLGNVLFRQGKNEDAIAQYRQAIRLNSKYAVAYNAIGVVLASQKRWDEAIAQYNRALRINANYGDALTNLAQALWEKGQKNEAIASLEKALQVFQAQDRPERVEQIKKILQQIKGDEEPHVS